jgi:FMN phosphatase YigB (HAD superfamily)
VYVGRASPTSGLPASKWANKFMIGRDDERQEVIETYERWLHDERPDLIAALQELRGKDLAC